ncbi:hypothetical protein Tco_0011673 [Tanacetum coccineum]
MSPSQIYGAVLPECLTSLEMKESKAYKTYLGYATFKKASPFKKESIVIREPLVETKSKRKEKEKVDVAHGKGIELLSEVALSEKAQIIATITPTVTSEGTGEKPGVPDVTEEDSIKSESESWDNDEDDSNNEQVKVIGRAKIVALENEVVEIKKDPLLTQVTTLVDEHLDTRLGETREEFMTFLSESLTARIKEQVKDQLPQILLEEVSNFAPPVIEKLFNESRDEVILAKVSSQPTGTKEKDSTFGSSKGTKSQPTSSGKSVQSEEPVFEVADSNMPQDQEGNLGSTDRLVKSFEEMMSTPIDFSTYILNGLQIKNLTQEILLGPAYKLLHKAPALIMMGIRIFKTLKNVKALSESLIGENPCKQSRGDVYSMKRILAVTYVKNQLINLSGEDVADFTIALKMFTRSLVIQRRVEDLQLGVESYQKKINVNKPDTTRPDLRKWHPYTPYKDPQGFIYVDEFERNRHYQEYRQNVLAEEKMKQIGKEKSSLYDQRHQQDAEGKENDEEFGEIHWCQNWRDLPRDNPLDSVEVLMYDMKKRNKSENKGIVPTKMELVLEQTQQGASHEVSVSTEGVEELKRKVKIKGEKKEALLTLRQKPERFDTLAVNPVKEILLKLNLPDHKSILTDLKDYIKIEMQIPRSSRVKFIATCSYSLNDFITSRKNDPKLPQTLISTSSSVCQSDKVMN